MTRSVHLFSFLLLNAAALLSGCTASSQSSMPAQTARSVSASAAAAPVGTGFDGRYVGSGVLTVNRNMVCGALHQDRSITVVNGNATYVVDQNRNIIVTGQVQPDGSVTLTSTTDQSSRVHGNIRNGVFTGEYVSSTCTRALELRRTTR